MTYTSGCLICGQELVYLDASKEFICAACGQAFESNACCVKGHYICDRCHGLPASDWIEQFCLTTEMTNPVEMSIALMRAPSVNMHGPEHHFLVPAVLLTSALNRGWPGDKQVMLKKACVRAGDVKGGACGFCGACGAGVGTGIFVSILTGSTPLSKTEWKLANLMTAASLSVIAEHGGPRCCKRDTFLALIAAGDFVKEHFDLDLGVDPAITCEFYPNNRECLGKGCPFHPNGRPNINK